MRRNAALMCLLSLRKILFKYFPRKDISVLVLRAAHSRADVGLSVRLESRDDTASRVRGRTRFDAYTVVAVEFAVGVEKQICVRPEEISADLIIKGILIIGNYLA